MKLFTNVAFQVLLITENALRRNTEKHQENF